VPGLRHSPLEAAHQALGAKLVPFGGWLMPLAYRGGTLAEHRACRAAAVVFDVSHLGTVRVQGGGAFGQLQRQLTNDLAKIGPGRAQYTHLLDEDDASVLDDIIVWWVDDEVFDVMPNASNTSGVLGALGGTDVTGERAVLAVQGPTARQVMAKVMPEAATVPRFAVAATSFAGHRATVAGTGYTGEDGIECAVAAEVAPQLWEAVVNAGAEPAGLGARDTLRLEAGLPLHGHELGPGITPLQAGLGWVVGWDKGDFRGRRPLEAERRHGPRRRLVGLRADGRQPPRQGDTVMAPGGESPAGTVTSGNFSPVLGCAVAMALLDTAPGHDAAPAGTALEVDVRGKRVRVQVADMPFVRRGRPAAAAPSPAEQR